ncbi:MAG: large subunit ribosomal protein [Thermoplasmata archaeon]|jgi:large subunit ribosomal protein L18|nr:large subunit ribosomal protein [Thermoplasmata archaeon]
MAHGPLYRVGFRRRREGKTDYRRRLGLLKSGETRVVVRTTNSNVIVQFVNYDETGDQIVASAEARELKEMGYTGANNTPSAYLTGLLGAKRAKEAGVGNGVLDLGRANPHKGGVIFGALKGVIDGGVEVPAGDVFPDEARLRAEHLKEKAAAFAASYEKIVGKPLPPKAEKPKGKGKPAQGKGAPAPQAKPAGKGGEPKPAKEKKAKTPE